jgi:hypothetical protein
VWEEGKAFFFALFFCFALASAKAQKREKIAGAHPTPRQILQLFIANCTRWCAA